MDLQLVCQILIVLSLAANFFMNLRRDFVGGCSAEPLGFQGAVTTIFVTTALVAVYYYAGAFSRIW